MSKKSIARIQGEIDCLHSRIREFEEVAGPSSPKEQGQKKKILKRLSELQKESAKLMQEYFEAHRALKPADAKRFLKKHKVADSS